MFPSVQQTSRHNERDALASLEAQYLARGYSFIREPRPEQLPAFLQSYSPDAVARKAGENVAIEVRPSPRSGLDQKLEQIRRLFDGHPDWKLVVTYLGSDPDETISIAPATADALTRRAHEIRELVAQGQNRAAFVMSWSLLEAVLHSLESDRQARPYRPGTVLQALAMLGHVDPSLEAQLRPLIALRNRIVHGDLSAEPTTNDVELLLAAVHNSIAGEAG
jgi:hypothetical protein